MKYYFRQTSISVKAFFDVNRIITFSSSGGGIVCQLRFTRFLEFFITLIVIIIISVKADKILFSTTPWRVTRCWHLCKCVCNISPYFYSVATCLYHHTITTRFHRFFVVVLSCERSPRRFCIFIARFCGRAKEECETENKRFIRCAWVWFLLLQTRLDLLSLALQLHYLIVSTWRLLRLPLRSFHHHHHPSVSVGVCAWVRGRCSYWRFQ